ncbi:MAG TPA: GNAT family N-acetyltransferase, partial [Lacibacter sp.]|nr:GNAT family N-acetyltransferase [Lacibacter sp.]
EAELQNPLLKYGPPKGVLYIAQWNHEVAGCIALMPLAEPGVCEMKRLYVRPAYRKHKIGKALVDLLIADAKRLGYTKMKLDTLQKLQPAIQLYKQYGFVETTAYYQNPLAQVVYMEKELTD